MAAVETGLVPTLDLDLNTDVLGVVFSFLDVVALSHLAFSSKYFLKALQTKIRKLSKERYLTVLPGLGGPRLAYEGLRHFSKLRSLSHFLEGVFLAGDLTILRDLFDPKVQTNDIKGHISGEELPPILREFRSQFSHTCSTTPQNVSLGFQPGPLDCLFSIYHDCAVSTLKLQFLRDLHGFCSPSLRVTYDALIRSTRCRDLEFIKWFRTISVPKTPYTSNHQVYQILAVWYKDCLTSDFESVFREISNIGPGPLETELATYAKSYVNIYASNWYKEYFNKPAIGFEIIEQILWESFKSLDETIITFLGEVFPNCLSKTNNHTLRRSIYNLVYKVMEPSDAPKTPKEFNFLRASIRHFGSKFPFRWALSNYFISQDLTRPPLRMAVEELGVTRKNLARRLSNLSSSLDSSNRFAFPKPFSGNADLVMSAERLLLGIETGEILSGDFFLVDLSKTFPRMDEESVETYILRFFDALGSLQRVESELASFEIILNAIIAKKNVSAMAEFLEFAFPYFPHQTEPQGGPAPNSYNVMTYLFCKLVLRRVTVPESILAVKGSLMHSALYNSANPELIAWLLAHNAQFSPRSMNFMTTTLCGRDRPIKRPQFLVIRKLFQLFEANRGLLNQA